MIWNRDDESTDEVPKLSPPKTCPASASRIRVDFSARTKPGIKDCHVQAVLRG
jgi:hypothetical protein